MLIIDMPMPKNCGECPLLYMKIVKCTVTGMDCTEYGAERPSWCPIKGVLVRCGECKWWDEEDGDCSRPNYLSEHLYCADGERKDGEG